MKETRYAHPANLPTLIPADAFPTTALVHPDTWAVQEHLVSTVASDEFSIDVVAAYAETMLRLWSLDGQPTAAAVLPRNPVRSSRRLPLSARLLWFLAADTAFRENLVDLLPLAIRLIRRLSTALRAPALTEAFPVLLQSPEPGTNDLFRFHWEIHHLRIYNRIGARVHRYLVREVDAGKGIGRVLTPIIRISQAFPADQPPRPAYRLDHNEAATRSLYKQVKEVVADLPNLFAPAQRLAPDSTQPKYVHQFMVSLDIAGFSVKGESLILTPGSRAPALEIDKLDTDPPEDPNEPFAAYSEHMYREAEEEGVLIEEPLSDDPAELAQAPDLEGLHPADALRRRTYVRQKATMHHDLPPDDWASLTLVDIALGYRALLEGTRKVSDLRLAQLADLFLYHLLVVTGRPWQWLLSAQMGTPPEIDGDDPQPTLDPAHPIFDPQRFAFFFTPAVYPALGKRLRPPEPDAGGEVDQQKLERWHKRWREHVRIYDEVSLVRALPLDPTACLLAAVYLDRRRQSIQAGPIGDGLPPVTEGGPLLVSRDENGPVRPYSARDAAALIDQVNAHRRSVRPDAPPVTRPRLRRATISRLAAGGMDRIAVHTLTGRHLPGLRAPLFYTLLSSERLTTSYYEAVDGLCAALGRAYERLRSGDDAPALPWATGKPPKPKASCPAWHYGAVYHPRLAHIRAVVQALLDNARRPPAAGVDDPLALERARHDALTVLACYLLTLVDGFRVGEVAGMQRAQIDLFDSSAIVLAAGIRGLVVAAGKSDRFYEEYRVVPAAPPLTPLLEHVLARSAQASGFNGPGDPAFWLYRSLPRPIPARRHHLWDYLDGIAHAAGLEEGAPRWHSARHFLHTFLYDRGMDERAIDYVLGHQAEGNEAGNPFRPSDVAAIFAAYQEATVALIDVLELDFDGLW